MNRSGEPHVRELAAQIWAGDRLLVWGGVTQSGDSTWVNHDDGALYDPKTDRWSAIASVGAPSGRGFTEPPVWTGDKLIVWGGYRYEGGTSISPKTSYPTDGALYDPATDSWKPMAPLDAQVSSMVWTGKKVVAIGKLDGYSTPGTVEFDGAVFDPAANSWSPMRAPDASMVAGVESAGRRLFWSGMELLLLAQRVEAGRGIAVLLRYDPDADAWSKTDVPESPGFAYWQSVLIAGDNVVISGPGPDSFDARGARHQSTQIMTFDAATSKWSSLPVLENRAWPIVVVSAGQILVWGGVDTFPDLDAHVTCGTPMGACDPITPMIMNPLGDGVRIGL
jgi:hypothetical protein